MGGVSQDSVDPAELRGFDEVATRAVASAAREARELGHDRVGTEHLLLGLLTTGSETSTTLADAGVTLAAARTKVSEAVGTSTELRAYVRLQVAGEEVAARQAWVNWIESASHGGLARAQLAEFELAN